MSPQLPVRLIDASDQVAALLEEIAPHAGIKIHRGDPDRAALQAMLCDADIIVNGHSYIDAEMMAEAKLLRGIVFLGSGASSYIDLNAAKARGIAVRTVSNYGDSAVAQHTLALVIDAVRQVSRMDRDIRDGAWRTIEGREFDELTVGVLGLGGIGRSFAALAARVGFKTLGWNRSPIEPPEGVRPASLETLLAEADILSLHLGYGPATAGFIDAEKIARMRKGSILVNTARAGLVEGDAMLAALKSGQLGHAALDVFDHEPLDPADPLARLPNTTLTSHAGFKTGQATRRLLLRALDEVRALQNSEGS